jgi:hypothetical protein
MGVKEKVKSTFELPSEVVIVKFIKRKKGLAANVEDNHVISGGMLSGAKIKYCAPLERNGAIANVLTKEEKDFLEERLGGQNLSVYGPFWKDYFVSLYKDDAENRFDLSNPLDYISIKVLLSWTNEVAPDWKSRNDRSTYRFVITRENEEFKEKKAKLDVKKTAFKLYGKIEDDREKLLGVLKLLSNQPISADSKLDWIQGKVEEVLDTKPSVFLQVLQDPSLDVKMLINNAVDANIIQVKSNKYKTIDGLDLCEAGQIASFDNAVKYLQNPKNQEVKSLLEARIDNSK